MPPDDADKRQVAATRFDNQLDALVQRAGILGFNPETAAGREIGRMFAEWYEAAATDIPEPIRQFAAERAVEATLICRSNFRTLMALKAPKTPKRVPISVGVLMDESGDVQEPTERELSRARKNSRADAQAANAAYNAALEAHRKGVSIIKDCASLLGLTRFLKPG